MNSTDHREQERRRASPAPTEGDERFPEWQRLRVMTRLMAKGVAVAGVRAVARLMRRRQ